MNGFPVGQARPQPALRLISNDELDANERAETDRIVQAENPILDRLSSHLTELWQKARDAKEKVQQRILDDYRRRNGEYSPDKLREIREFGGSEIWMMLTNQKCRATKAWLRDVLIQADDRAFSVDPTPLPEMSPDVFKGLVEKAMQGALQEMQATGIEPTREELQAHVMSLKEELEEQLEKEASDKAEKMETKIADQFEEGGYREAFEECLDDLSTTLACIMKGPVVRCRNILKWAPDPETGKTAPKVEKVYRYEYERVSPLNMFPAPDAGSDIQKTWFFERAYLQIDDLTAMRGQPGVDDAKLNKIIADHGETGFRSLQTGDHEQAKIEGNQYGNWEGYATGIETKIFWGNIQGSLLVEWAKDGKVDLASMNMQDVDRNETYPINAWKTDDIVWKVTRNMSPLGMKPYSKTSFEKVPGSFWGRGPAIIIGDCQDMCNATARALVNNMGQSSSYQVIVNDSSRITPETQLDKHYPGKTWIFKEPRPGTTSSGPPMEFFQPDSRATELMAVFDQFSTLADQYLGMPQFPLQEMSGSGAGSTASGVAMALGTASKGAKNIIGNIDMDITEPMVERQYIANMMYEDDESIKGDAKGKARGSNALIVKEQQQLRRLEFQARVAQDPIAQQLMGIDGYAKLIAEDAKSLDLPLSDLNLDDRGIKRKAEEMKQQQMQQAQMQQQAAMQGQALLPDGSPAGGEQGVM